MAMSNIALLIMFPGRFKATALNQPGNEAMLSSAYAASVEYKFSF